MSNKTLRIKDLPKVLTNMILEYQWNQEEIKRQMLSVASDINSIGERRHTNQILSEKTNVRGLLEYLKEAKWMQQQYEDAMKTCSHDGQCYD